MVLTATIYCKSCPLKIKYVSQKRLDNPWLTSGNLKSIEMKSFYFKQFILGLIDDNFYKMYKNRSTVVIKNAKNCTIKMLLIVIRRILRKHYKL